MPDPISTLALATGGAFLGKFVGPAAEHLGKLALERAQHLGQKATALLTAAGREPQPVEPKLLVPLVQAASLETDETLSAHWAALLANAADPARSSGIVPAYIEILRQLSPREAQLLYSLFLEIDAAVQPLLTRHLVVENKISRKRYATEHLLNLDSFYYKDFRDSTVAFAEIEARNRFDALVDNLLRQQTIILATARPKREASIVFDYKPDRSKAFLTSLGYDFMLAVTPPTA
jgi:hypothetical protein